MNIWQTTQQATQLLFSGDSALWGIVGVSFSVSLFAIALVIIPSLLIAFALAYGKFPGRWLILSLMNTLQSVPTVVIGLLLYMLLSRAGAIRRLANALYSKSDDFRPSNDLFSFTYFYDACGISK